MERITQNPGFHHIAENIFIYLDHETLLKCLKVNKYWKAILQNNPTFWLWKCVVEWAKYDPNLPDIYELPGLSKNHHEKWTKLIQKLNNNPGLKQNLTSILMAIHKEGVPKDFSPQRLHHPFYLAWKFRDFALVENYLEKVDECKIIENEVVKKEIFSTQYSQFTTKVELTPIQEATADGDDEALEIFVKFAKNPNAPDSSGYTPIQRAVKRGYSDLLNVVKILAPISKNPNAKDPEGWTPIARAATNCQLEFVKALVPYCDNPNAVSFDGFTPLQRLVMKFGYPGGEIENEYKEVCELLIRSRTTENPNAATPGNWLYGGWTPIQIAAFKGNEKLFNLFAPFVEDPHDLDPYGESLIQRVAMRGTVEMMKFLIPLTNNPNAPNERGFTPIHRAASRGKTEIIKLLAPFSEDPNAPDPDGWTPIQLATLNSFKGSFCDEIVDILAPKTKNPNAPDPFGLTPIQHATSNGHGLKMEVKSKIRRVMPRRQCKIGPKRYVFKHYQRKKRQL